jgi:hypothetical protein
MPVNGSANRINGRQASIYLSMVLAMKKALIFCMGGRYAQVASPHFIGRDRGSLSFAGAGSACLRSEAACWMHQWPSKRLAPSSNSDVEGDQIPPSQASSISPRMRGLLYRYSYGTDNDRLSVSTRGIVRF